MIKATWWEIARADLVIISTFFYIILNQLQRTIEAWGTTLVYKVGNNLHLGTHKDSFVHRQKFDNKPNIFFTLFFQWK